MYANIAHPLSEGFVQIILVAVTFSSKYVCEFAGVAHT